MSRVYASGDPRADKRYDLAMGYFADKDYAAARDLLTQTLELAPAFLPALAKLGDILALLHFDSDAKQVFMQLIALDEADVFGGRLALALLEKSVTEMSPGYVAALFDDYAPRFEKALVEDLHYQAPRLLYDALAPLTASAILDVGCGTGLMGELLHTDCQTLVGVDLSAEMVALAARKNIYTALHVGDMVDFMPDLTYQMVIAADVLVYVGDLRRFIDAAHRCLLPQGVLAFTLQAHEGDGFILGEDWRYAHSEHYVRDVLADRFHVKRCEAVSSRQNKNQPVKGWLVVAQKL